MEIEIRDMHVKNELYRMILALSGETIESLPYDAEVIDKLYGAVLSDFSRLNLEIVKDFSTTDIEASVEYVGLYEDGIRDVEDRCMSRNDLVDEAVNNMASRLVGKGIPWNAALFCNLEDDLENATTSLQKSNGDKPIAFCHPWYNDDEVLCVKISGSDSLFPCGRKECLCKKSKRRS